MNANFPIMIVCRDRLTPLVDLVAWLEAAGYDRLMLVDNDSTYPPLLDFFENSAHEVIRLDRNLGPWAPWRSGLVDRRVRNDFYAVTDCDVVPDQFCPSDAVHVLHWALSRYPEYVKAGLGLRVDDLPEWNTDRDEVQEWERQFWTRPFGGNLYHAQIDTTFALYRPDSGFAYGPGIRSGFPYVARHMPWYSHSAAPTEEERYYATHCRRGTSSWTHSDLHPQLSSRMNQELHGTSRRTAYRLRWTAHKMFRMKREQGVPRRYPGPVWVQQV